MSRKPTYCEVLKRGKKPDAAKIESKGCDFGYVLASDDILGMILSHMNPKCHSDQSNALLVNKTWNRVGWKNMEFDNDVKFDMTQKGSIKAIVKLMTNPRCDLGFYDNCMVLSVVTDCATLPLGKKKFTYKIDVFIGRRRDECIKVAKLLLESGRTDPSDRKSVILYRPNVPFELMKIILLNERMDLSRYEYSVFRNAAFEGDNELVDMLMKDKRINFGELLKVLMSEADEIEQHCLRGTSKKIITYNLKIRDIVKKILSSSHILSDNNRKSEIEITKSD